MRPFNPEPDLDFFEPGALDSVVFLAATGLFGATEEGLFAFLSDVGDLLLPVDGSGAESFCLATAVVVVSMGEVGRLISPSISKLDPLECTGELNTMAGIEAISGGAPTGCSFSSCLTSPSSSAIWSSFAPTLLKSESKSNPKSADDASCGAELTTCRVDPSFSSTLDSPSGCALGEGVLTSGRVGGISMRGDSGIETPSLRLLGVVGDEEPEEACGDSGSTLPALG